MGVCIWHDDVHVFSHAYLLMVDKVTASRDIYKPWVSFHGDWRDHLAYILKHRPTLEELCETFRDHRNANSRAAARHNVSIFISREMIPLDFMIPLYQIDFLMGLDYAKEIRENIYMKGDRGFQIAVVERDHVCVKCGTNQALSGHHLVHRGHKRSRFDPRNGVALCHDCHFNWAHGPGQDEITKWLAFGRDGALFTSEEDWLKYKRAAMNPKWRDKE